ncbi:MAG TPA: alpha-hydroxy acid oxidase [Opitutaceae bacterium]|jgi:4-hydroxymandelate oxidase|nr:alpha-hydroxy acid oxidase [Opitutaceae bacterium]
MPGPLEPLAAIPAQIASVSDYEPFARERMSDNAWAYVSGGAGDEITLRRNREAFEALRLRGRVLSDLSGGDTGLEIAGQKFDAPILLAPVAYLKLAHPQGEAAALLAASATGCGFVISTHSSSSLEEMGAASSARRPWFQLYFQPERSLTLELVQAAERSGCAAIVVTLDAPVNGNRNREQRAAFRLPPGIDAVLTRVSSAPMLFHGTAGAPLCGGILERAPTWKDIEWLKSVTELPIFLKGIMDEDDASQALEAGVGGLVVSNHGGRTLDTLPATIDVLPRIAQRVSGRVPLLLDGGVRRGTDILKALALGASAVLIGRPYVFALAAAGAPGVAHVVNIMRAELEVAMALTGCRNLKAIGPKALWR